MVRVHLLSSLRQTLSAASGMLALWTFLSKAAVSSPSSSSSSSSRLNCRPGNTPPLRTDKTWTYGTQKHEAPNNYITTFLQEKGKMQMFVTLFSLSGLIFLVFCSSLSPSICLVNMGRAFLKRSSKLTASRTSTAHMNSQEAHSFYKKNLCLFQSHMTVDLINADTDTLLQNTSGVFNFKFYDLNKLKIKDVIITFKFYTKRL